MKVEISCRKDKAFQKVLQHILSNSEHPTEINQIFRNMNIVK